MLEIKFQPVDTRLLTKDERARYAELTNPAGMNALPVRDQLRLHRPTFMLLALWLIATLAAAAASWIAAIVVLLLGPVALFAAANSFGTKALQKRVDDYLVEIGYAERVRASDRPRPTTSDDDGYQWKSTRQMQHEWYEGHSELDWHDRVRAEMYGIDVETYVSNVLENDKD